MKDSLKDFIGQNREAFDDREPSDEAWKPIQESLPAKRRFLISQVGLWRAAAFLLLGLSIYLFATRGTTTLKQKEIAGVSGVGDFKDLESYYHGQIIEKIGLINDFDAAGEHEQFTQDFQKLDAMYQVLSDEMKNRPSEKVKDALVLNLLVRIDLLNQQLKKLEDSRRKRNTEKSV